MRRLQSSLDSEERVRMDFTACHTQRGSRWKRKLASVKSQSFTLVNTPVSVIYLHRSPYQVKQVGPPRTESLPLAVNHLGAAGVELKGECKVSEPNPHLVVTTPRGGMRKMIKGEGGA